MHSEELPSGRCSVHTHPVALLMSVMLKADSDVKLDHISLNRFPIFYNKNYFPFM
jgi:hypothetical protein